MDRGSISQEIIDKVYSLSFEKYTEEPKKYRELFDIKASKKAYEFGTDFLMMADVQEVEEGEDSSDSKIAKGFTWHIKNRTLQASIPISWEVIEDGNINIEEIAQELGSSFASKEERYAARIFNRGAWAGGDYIFNTAIAGVLDNLHGNKIYDDKCFFATDHPDKQEPTPSTYSNYNASAELNAVNLANAFTQFQYTNAYNNVGEPIVLTPDTLLVPANGLYDTASVLMNSQLLPGSAMNDINVLKGRVNIVQWRYLEDANAWFLGAKKKGVRWYDRSPLHITQEQDKGKRKTRIILYKRIGLGVYNWRYWLANNLVAA